MIDFQWGVDWLVGVRELKVPEAGPKRKLLEATERLVVEKGFDLVSVRDITGAVKANVAAVNYHFGSREGLMDLVVLHVMETLNATRTEALEIAQKNAGENTASLEAILTAYVHSLTVTAERLQIDPPFFLKLAGRVSVFPEASMAPTSLEARREVADRFLQAVAAATPASSPDELSIAWSFFDAGLGQAMIQLGADHSPTVQLEHWIRFGIRGFGSTKPQIQNPPKEPEKPVEIQAAPEPEPTAPEPEPIPESAKAPARKKPTAPKKQDNQTMLFDL